MEQPSENRLEELLESSTISWIRWRSSTAYYQLLERAVQNFQSLPVPAGSAATKWLKQNALQEETQSRTYIAIANGNVQGFYALAASTVQLAREASKEKPGQRITQPAVLISWVAKADDTSLISGKELLYHALGTIYRNIVPHLGVETCAVDPFDQEIRVVWQERFSFRPSANKNRLWMPLFETTQNNEKHTII